MGGGFGYGGVFFSGIAPAPPATPVPVQPTFCNAAAELLQHWNITIEPGRVMRSFQVLAETGETFLIDSAGNCPGGPSRSGATCGAMTKVSGHLLGLILEVADRYPIYLTSLTTCDCHQPGSSHYEGRGVDFGPSAEIIEYIYQNRVRLRVDELIFKEDTGDAVTLKGGVPSTYSASTLNGHSASGDTPHYHVSVLR